MSKPCRSSMTIVLALLTCLSLSCTEARRTVSDEAALPLPSTGYEGVVSERLWNGGAGHGIPDVSVTFVGEDGKVKRTVSTNAKGMYRVALPRGGYLVTARHRDYEDYSSAPGVFVVTGKGYQKGSIFLVSASPTTILLLRHAEKATNPPDNPPLTPEGQARAKELVHVAEKAGVKGIYATDTLRSQQTVQPLAAHLGIAVSTYGYNDYAGLRNSILSNHLRRVVVVAGHTDTLAAIAGAFGIDQSKVKMTGDEFDNLWVITLFGVQKAGCVNLQYGAVSP